jgi:hypothetical protein
MMFELFTDSIHNLKYEIVVSGLTGTIALIVSDLA